MSTEENLRSGDVNNRERDSSLRFKVVLLNFCSVRKFNAVSLGFIWFIGTQFLQTEDQLPVEHLGMWLKEVGNNVICNSCPPF